MSTLLHKLGIDWKLLISQGVNFLILLVVLTKFVYRPLIRIMKERAEKIHKGLEDAEEAKRRLVSIDAIKTQKLAEADKSAVEVIAKAEEVGKKRYQEILMQADARAADVLQEADRVAEHKKIEGLNTLTREARGLIKEAIIKTTEADPQAIDEALIEKAIQTLTRQRTS